MVAIFLFPTWMLLPKHVETITVWRRVTEPQDLRLYSWTQQPITFHLWTALQATKTKVSTNHGNDFKRSSEKNVACFGHESSRPMGWSVKSSDSPGKKTAALSGVKTSGSWVYCNPGRGGRCQTNRARHRRPLSAVKCICVWVCFLMLRFSLCGERDTDATQHLLHANASVVAAADVFQSATKRVGVLIEKRLEGTVQNQPVADNVSTTRPA